MMKVYGFIDKHEAKLMVKDYKQKQGFDHFNIYSSITRITSTCMLIYIVALNDLEIHHMNFKTALLNGRRINLYEIAIRIQSTGEGNEYVYAC